MTMEIRYPSLILTTTTSLAIQYLHIMEAIYTSDLQITIPLMITMIVAGISVHLKNGWLAIAEGSGFFANERTAGAIERLDIVKNLMKDYGNYEWLTENGSVVILNNGIEFAVTYFIMLLALFFLGAGSYVSVDYWLKGKFKD